MSKVINIEIDASLQNRTIEYVLEKELKISSTLVKRLKRVPDGILLNGVHATVITKVSEGDTLIVNIPDRESDIIPVNMPLDILFEDEDILVVNKSGAIPVHPSRTHKTDTLANAVAYHIGESAVHIITRLDRETSGVVLIAKNSQAAAILTDAIKRGKIKKEYMAIVNGEPSPCESTISAPIKKVEGRGIARCVSDDGKEAVTRYEVLEKNDTFSCVRLFPITGRTHQLRVHMSHIGHPIYGDRMYSAPQTGERTRLHCYKLTFEHPITEKGMSVTAEIPDDFSVVKKF